MPAPPRIRSARRRVAPLRFAAHLVRQLAQESAVDRCRSVPPVTGVERLGKRARHCFVKPVGLVQPLELISKRQAGQQVGILNKTYGKEDEPVKLPVPKPEERPMSRLERLAYRALLREKITASQAAEVLDKPLLEVRQRLADYLKKLAAGASSA